MPVRKNESLVNIYAINDPENFNCQPIVSIERKGKRRRATAGCLGFTRHQDKMLLVVGDWNSRHLDFYSCLRSNWEEQNYHFQQFASVAPKQRDRSQWIDKKWRTYQNINLFSNPKSKELHLIGFDGWYFGRDVADLFLINPESGMTMHKIASKKLQLGKAARFVWGAGAFTYGSGQLGIIACGYRSRSNSFLSFYMG